MYLFTYVYVCMCQNACSCVNTYIYILMMDACMNVFIYVCTYTHSPRHTYTHMNTFSNCGNTTHIKQVHCEKENPLTSH